MTVVPLNCDKPKSVDSLMRGASIEVMPRTAAKIDDFRALLPEGTRIYIAHIDGTPIDDMIALAKRLSAEGFSVMPHLPARIIPGETEFSDWVRRYAEEAGVREALVLGGSPTTPNGPFESSIQLMETGVFDKYGFKRLHVAGHPEGNRDIEPIERSIIVDDALRWKAAFAAQNGIDMAVITQFMFDGQGLFEWLARLEELGLSMPVHVGLAGPAKLQTLVKFAIACGVGPSIKVLQKRAKDLSQLVRPYTPAEMLTQISEYQGARTTSLIKGLHVFPLGGIRASTDFMVQHSKSIVAHRA